MAEKSIKARYVWLLRAFVALNTLVGFVAFSGSDVVRAVELSQWVDLIEPKLLLSLALPFATLILDGIVTSDFKEVLVCWRLKNTLPGHRAFSVHAKADPRVDMKALEDKHGPLPLSANVRETRSTQRIRVGRRQRKRTCWDCEREWKRMVVPLEPGRPSEARQLLRTQR